MADLGGPSEAASVAASVADPADSAIPSPLWCQVSSMFGAMWSIRQTIGARTPSLPSTTNVTDEDTPVASNLVPLQPSPT
jgi:hypothetical protein